MVLASNFKTMKQFLWAGIFLFAMLQLSCAQRVRTALTFPGGVTVVAPGPAPYAGAVWVAPEWKWQRGGYVHVPGYWAKSPGRNKRWVSGHWKNRRGWYVWVPGRWR